MICRSAFVPVIFLCTIVCSCTAPKYKWIGKHASKTAEGGSVFYEQAAAMHWAQRDSLALVWWQKGNWPDWLERFERITIKGVDALSNKAVTIKFYASTDYLCLGNNQDWARICITPMAAKMIADDWLCVLPTTRIVDEIYNQSRVKLSPVPLFAFRDSTPTMLHHHLIIEGQRKEQEGLISGIKKDVVQTPLLLEQGKQNKVAIYGWHKPGGKPIQPLYTGHVSWYVDYSHGIRLIYQYLYINGQQVLLQDALRNPGLHHLLCDEKGCNASSHG